MARGRVKWFDQRKGYGFIVVEGSEDIFVHYSAIKVPGFRTLEEGQAVEFKLQQGDKGLSAEEVLPL